MFVLIMYVVLVILSIVNARLANNKISKNLLVHMFSIMGIMCGN